MHRSADASVRLFDHRKISASGQGVPIEQFEGHSAAVLCVQVYSIASEVIKLYHSYNFISTCVHSELDFVICRSMAPLFESGSPLFKKCCLEVEKYWV